MTPYVRTAKRGRKKHWRRVGRKELAGGTFSRSVNGDVVSVTVFMKTKPRKRKYGLSAATVSYGTMWGVCVHLTDIPDE